MYETEKTFNVIKGIVPNFGLKKGDITLVYTVDGVKQSGTFPKKNSGLYATDVNCEDGASASWNNTDWGLVNIEPGISKNIVCTISFKKMSFSDYIISLADQSTENLEKFEHGDTNQTGNKAKIDYRFVGENPNNYVCLEDGACTEDNLYRIIGVIPTQKEINGEYENRVKLIKEKNDETSAWTMNSTNLNWETSTIYANLKTFYDSLGDKQKYIEESVWYMGSPTTDQNAITPVQFYTQERGNSKGYGLNYLSIVSNVAIMYPSDYGFSMGNTYINSSLYTNRNTFLKSWLYQFKNKAEWTISPDDGYWTSTMGYAVGIEGQCWASRVYIDGVSSILGYHPTFYLKTNVLYQSGNGTKESPFKISLAE